VPEMGLRCALARHECGALRSAHYLMKRPAAEWIRRVTTEETLRCARRTLAPEESFSGRLDLRELKGSTRAASEAGFNPA